MLQRAFFFLMSALIVPALAQDAERRTAWEPVALPLVEKNAPTELFCRAAGNDTRFERDAVPPAELLQNTLSLSGWRGERVHAQAVVWGNARQVRPCPLQLHGENGTTVAAEVSFLRYTSAKGKLYADIIDEDAQRLDVPTGTCRPLWIHIDIPRDTPAGSYTGTLCVHAENAAEARVGVRLEVEPATLPPPAEWGVHLDLWQHPHAVARIHGVRPWSEEHFSLMRPLMQRLADAGQKVITCSVIDEAWNGQTYDAWPSMVQWVRGKDGIMRYDFSLFDQYVEFMMELGIREQISCYTMLPWSLKVRYRDEKSGNDSYLALEPGKPSFEEIWAPFLQALRDHVRQKGWLDITCMSLDERPDAYVRATIDIIHRHAPELKIVSAVNAPSQLSEHIHDMSPILGHARFAAGEPDKRRARGQKTTFYVCLHPPKPNTFTASPTAEAEWLGLFAAANRLDGFLRWAYNSWNRNPLEKTDFVHWPAGDCWLVYPGNRSSVHFECLRDGLEDFEKIALLRRAAAAADASATLRRAVADMDALLAELFTIERSSGDTHENDVLRATEAIRAAVAVLAE